MFRGIALSLVLVVAGFVGGVVATGWVRAAESARSEPPRAAAAAPAPRAPEPLAAAPAQPAAAAPAAAGADFTRVAGQAVKGVANISSLQVVRTRNSPFGDDPFFRYFFGDDQMFGARD